MRRSHDCNLTRTVPLHSNEIQLLNKKMASANKKPKHVRNFQDSWITDRDFKDWLVKEIHPETKEITMRCLICKEANVKNVFASGCSDFQRSTLVRHMSSDAHRRAVQIKSSRKAFQKSFKTAETKSGDSLHHQLKTVYFMAENNIALNTFAPLIDLQKSNGCEILSNVGHYTAPEIVSEMLQCLASSLNDDVKRKIQNSKFIGILTDESCDIAVFKKLIIYVQTFTDGKIDVSFATNLDVNDGKAETIFNAINEWLVSWEIPIAKVMGLATDGAAVMTGVRSGVGVRMKNENPRLVHIHCVAHKLALAVSQAAASVRVVKTYEDTLQSLYFYFHNSAVRYNRLRAVYALLEDDSLITLKRPHAVRWLSLHQAVSAIYSSWGALVTTLGEEAANNDQARGYLRQVDKFMFIALTSILVDILPLFTRLSKVFQRSCLDFGSVGISLLAVRNTLTTFGQDTDTLTTYSDMHQEVITTGSYQGHPVTITDAEETSFIAAKDALLGSLLEKLEQRFPSQTMDVLKSLDAIFSPTLYPEDHAAVANYGTGDLQLLLDHYQPENAVNAEILLNRDRCLRDFLPFKHHTRYMGHMKFPEYVKYVTENLNEEYPDYVVLGQLAMSVPLNSASCERGFSKQNLTKTKPRNRLSQSTLQDIMTISINGPHFAQFDYTQAALKFRAMKDRRK